MKHMCITGDCLGDLRLYNHLCKKCKKEEVKRNKLSYIISIAISLIGVIICGQMSNIYPDQAELLGGLTVLSISFWSFGYRFLLCYILSIKWDQDDSGCNGAW